MELLSGPNCLDKVFLMQRECKKSSVTLLLTAPNKRMDIHGSPSLKP
jgi:hypothetical protein